MFGLVELAAASVFDGQQILAVANAATAKILRDVFMSANRGLHAAFRAAR